MNSTTTTLTARQKLSWVALALVAFVVVQVARAGHPPEANDADYAQYLLHAKALAEGRPYSDIGYIYSELNLVGPRNQPPGWPIVLAPFVAVFGVQSSVFTILVAVLVAAFGVAAGVYFARQQGWPTGVAVAAIVPIALTGQNATDSAMSDPLFCVIVWLTLLWCDSASPWTWRRALGVGVMAAAAISVRVAGVALVPALLLYGIVEQPRTRWRSVIPLIAIAVIGAAVVFVARDNIPFLDHLDLPTRQRVVSLTNGFREAYLGGTLYPFPGNRPNDLYHVAILPFVVVGVIQMLRRRPRAVHWYFLAANLAMFSLSPVFEARYLWPLTPLLAAGMVTGLLTVAGWLMRATPGRATVVTAAIVAFLVVGSSVRLIAEPPNTGLTGDPDAEALFDRIRTESASAPVRVVFFNPRVLTLETGTPAMGMPFGTEEVVLGALTSHRITHVILRLRNPTRRSEREMAGLVQQSPDVFPELMRNASYSLHRFVQPAGTAMNQSRPAPARTDGFARHHAHNRSTPSRTLTRGT